MYASSSGMQPTPAPCTETCIFRKEDCGQKASLHAAARFKDYANIAENRLSEYWIFWQHKRLRYTLIPEHYDSIESNKRALD
uniref:Uncharacterized protein n=1 Tax=Timema douglasi TaxID=61478 RepID=A0A7R8ZCC6_TIMDO|nr:unnamed protein product [Timema douglasi]